MILYYSSNKFYVYSIIVTLLLYYYAAMLLYTQGRYDWTARLKYTWLRFQLRTVCVILQQVQLGIRCSRWRRNLWNRN